MIRRAHQRDITALSELAIKTYSDAFGHTFSAADLAAHIKHNLAPENFARMLDKDVILVAEVGNRLVGYTQFGAMNPSFLPNASPRPADQELRRLYVHSEFQNQGYGSALMEAALHHPRMTDAATIYLDVWEHNHGAQRFYQRYGFTVVGTRPFTVESSAETSLDLIMARRSSSNQGKGMAAC